MRTLKRPAALFLVSDRAAQVLMDACLQEGIKIPADIAVITAGSHPECGSPTISLTRPEADGAWLLDVVCEQLEDRMRNHGRPIDLITIQCPNLVQGDSTRILVSDDPMATRAVEYIDAHFHDGINVADVVRHLGCSRRLLERRFSAAFGRGPHEYIVSLRVTAAKDMIAANPGAKLSFVARACGFGGYQAFRIAFHELTGKTPSAWRG